jgi:hypothetical protein
MESLGTRIKLLKPSGTLWFEVAADKSAEPKETPLLSIARRSLDGANLFPNNVCQNIMFLFQHRSL